MGESAALAPKISVYEINNVPTCFSSGGSLSSFKRSFSITDLVIDDAE